jgi:group I intron endonuclease
MSYGSIYKVTNTVNSKIYIGQTRQNPASKRWYSHKWDALHGRTKTAFANALVLHGCENFTFEVICTCSNLEELNKKEQEYILLFSSLAPSGYNLMKGGDNFEKSNETREKLSSSLKGRIINEEWRKNISDGHRGLKKSEETKKKIRDAHLGMSMSEETKEKLRQAHTGKKASAETIQKMSEKRKGVPWSEKRRNATIGRKHSEETKQKLSMKMKGHFVTDETRNKIRNAKLNRV